MTRPGPYLFPLAAVLFCGPPQIAFGQDQPYPVQRLPSTIVLDGMPDDAAWQAVAPLPLTVFFPVLDQPPSEATEIRLSYDDAYLYAAASFFDSDQSGIRGQSLTRDRMANSDDIFALILDSFDDNENALAFMTTPTGIRIDQTVFNDAQFSSEGMPLNESWNTFWDAVTVVNEEGWFAEMRIPWSSLRFQDRNGQVDMGLLTWRWISRKAEAHGFPVIDPKYGFMASFKPSIAQTVRFEGIYAQKPIYMTPYALSGVTREAELNNLEDAYLTDTDLQRELGADLKYSLTSNLTLDVTANTDFAQVEADDQQVNLTRFSLFFPEKRQFFQERSSIFEFNTGGPTRLFYSRRIGLSDEGPIRILGGARMVGRVGRWDVGFLDMQAARARFSTDDGIEEVPAENFGVLRLRRRVINDYSYAGAIVASRLGDDGSHNVAFGLDGTFRVADNDYLLVSWAQTFDDEIQANSLNNALARVRLEKRLNRGWAYDLSLTRTGPDYDPGLGFIFRTDGTQLGDRVFYTWEAADSSPFISRALGVQSQIFLRNTDGQVESAQVGPLLQGAFRDGGFGFILPSFYLEDLTEEFELDDDVVVPEGHYEYAGVTAFYQMGPRLLGGGLMADAGTFFDGWRVSVGITPTWYLSRHFELGGEYQLNRIEFPDRNQSLSADIVRLRIRTALNTHLSFSTFAQLNTGADDLTINARLRYNFSEGNDLYVVFNEGLNTSLDGSPRLPRTDARTLLVKYTYTFVQ